ncbi:unnamed protein product [Withania somnifera]
MVALTAKIMMAVIAFLFFVVILVFFLHVYAKMFASYRQEDEVNPNAVTRQRRRRRFDFAGGYQEVNALRRDLYPCILKTIPIIPFDTKNFKDGLECSVCLTEISQGEKAKLLPKCNHGFHVDCIDISEAITTPTQEGSASTETPNLPTNVLYWGDETTSAALESTSNRPYGVLMIDIPRQKYSRS